MVHGRSPSWSGESRCSRARRGAVVQGLAVRARSRRSRARSPGASASSQPAVFAALPDSSTSALLYLKTLFPSWFPGMAEDGRNSRRPLQEFAPRGTARKREPDGDDRSAGKVQVEAGMQHPGQGDLARAEHERIGKRADRKHEGRRRGKSDRERDQHRRSVSADGKTAADRQEGRRVAVLLMSSLMNMTSSTAPATSTTRGKPCRKERPLLIHSVRPEVSIASARLDPPRQDQNIEWRLPRRGQVEQEGAALPVGGDGASAMTRR